MPRKARGRMLWGSISTSERVNRLSLKAALLYTWLLTHADDQGRMSGDTETVKAVVVPLRKDIEVAEVPKLLIEMEVMELVILYSNETVFETPTIIQVVNWWDYQALREPKPSRYPPPDGWSQDKVAPQLHDQAGRFNRDER